MKTLLVIKCRYSSRRLPGKALYPLAGVPMLAFLLRRLSVLPPEDYVTVLATTRSGQDDIVAAWAAHEGVAVVRGEEDDVLRRYIRCLSSHAADYVVRVTADNPLTCPETLQRCVKLMAGSKADYALSVNHPVGAGVDVFTSELLRQMDAEAKDPSEREHINAFIINNPGRFKTIKYRLQGPAARPDISMTVDTPEDWLRVNSIFTPGEPEPWRMALAEAVKRLDSSTVA